MGTYTAKTRNIGKRPRSKRLRELGGTVINNSGAMPDLSGCELVSNKVTEVDQNSTDEQYPTAKLLYDLYAALGVLITALDEGKQDAISDLAAIRSGAALGATALQAITAAAGSDIGTVGTPSVTVSTQGSSTTLTFHQLKGAKGDKGDTGATGPQGPAGAGTTVDSALSDSSTNPVQNKVVKAALDGKATLANPNNFVHAGNEITMVPSGYNGALYFNYRTVGGTNGNITSYILGNGKGGNLGTALHSGNYSSYALPLSGGTVTGNILANATAALGTLAAPFHQLVLGGATGATMGATTTNPRITFVEDTGFQPVNLVYCDYDSYRAPAGLKVVGDSSNSSSPAWFEVEGKIYAAGGTISDTAITTAKTVLDVVAGVSSPSTSNNVYGIKATLTQTGSNVNTNSAAIYGVASAGYAGLFSGMVKVSSTLTANSVSAATVYQTSDDRLKDYVGDFHFALTDIDKIPLRFFTFKDDPDKRVLIGTSAQAVQKVLPEIVGSSRTASEEDSEEYLNVDYSKLALVALDCVRQLRDEVAALRAEIEELKRGR